MIPVKTVLTGSTEYSQLFIGFARRQMKILERLMSFQKLNQGSRTVKPFDGVIVECWSSFSLQEVRIHVDEAAFFGVARQERRRAIECPCFPCFSLGRILAVRSESDGLTMEKAVYDVDVCKKDFYVRYENYPIYSLGLETYKEGQFVMVAVEAVERLYDSVMPKCLGNTSCVVSSADPYEFLPETLFVVPVYMTDGMKRWEEYEWLVRNP